jgi:hypothetical protein
LDHDLTHRAPGASRRAAFAAAAALALAGCGKAGRPLARLVGGPAHGDRGGESPPTDDPSTVSVPEPSAAPGGAGDPQAAAPTAVPTNALSPVLLPDDGLEAGTAAAGELLLPRTRALDVVRFADFLPAAPQAKRGAQPLDPRAVMIPSVGQDAVLPSCGYATSALKAATGLRWTIDGDLADWQGRGLVSVDRAGNPWPGATPVDVRALYLGTDDASVVVAVAVDGAFPTAASAPVVQLEFRALDLGALSTSPAEPFYAADRLVVSYAAGRLAARAGSAAAWTTVAGGEAAVRGGVLEMRLPRALFGGRLAAPWLVRLDLAESDADDAVRRPYGIYLDGLEADYTCLVPVSQVDYKVVTMLRTPDVRARRAEHFYRAIAAAAAAVERSFGDSYRRMTTIPFVVAGDGAPGGSFHHEYGITVGARAFKTQPAAALDPVEMFRVVAHEYAHGINAADWRLPEAWMREGLSEYAAGRAIAAVFGDALALRNARTRRIAFLHGELERGRIDLGDDADMLQDAGDIFSPFYAKAMLLFDGLARRLGWDAVRGVLAAPYGRGTAYVGRSELFKALEPLVPAAVPRTSAMWSAGWFGGGYGGAFVQPDALVADADGDGLPDADETERQLDPAHEDTDADGLSDLAELALGLDPRAADPAATRAFVADHGEADWRALAPQALRTGGLIDQASCSAASRLSRYGVLRVGDTILALGGMEQIARAADGAGLQVQLFPDASAADPTRWSATITFEDFTSTLFHGASVVGGTAYLTAPEGGDVAEIAVTRAQTGLDAAAFAKLRAQVCSSDASGLCTCSPVLDVAAYP